MKDISSCIEKTVEILKNGGIVAVPTEGIYGLSCDASNVEAVQRLRTLKQRDDNKGFIVVGADLDQLKPFIFHRLQIAKIEKTLTAKQLSLVQSTWPGPVTWLIPVNPNISTLIHGDDPTIAVRVTAHPLLSEICRKLGKAIISTSANKAGESPALRASEIDDIFTINQVDYILDGPLGELSGPTEIRDLQSNAIIRPLT